MNSLKNKRHVAGPLIDRRKFIRMGLITAASALLSKNAVASALEPEAEVRELHFYNLYTHEDLKVVYWKDGWYVPDALARIDYIFRDIHNGKVMTIKTDLLDLLFDIRRNVHIDKPFQIVSGYRTPGSNAMLSKQKKGVAKNSLHMYGKAVDIRVPGFSLRSLRREAMKLGRGGVGYYPRSHFVHVDVGKVRYWRG